MACEATRRGWEEKGKFSCSLGMRTRQKENSRNAKLLWGWGERTTQEAAAEDEDPFSGGKRPQEQEATLHKRFRGKHLMRTDGQEVGNIQRQKGFLKKQDIGGGQRATARN